MLTPQFDIRQNDQFLIIEIVAPYTKVSETEIFFADAEFRFYSKPYFLRLNLPGEVNENGEESASYDIEKGTFIINVPKLNYGEYFEGLDLQTKLLANKKKTICGPSIEVIGDTSACEENKSEEEEFSWEVYQNPYTDEQSETLSQDYKYGFANQKSGIFTKIQNEIPDLIDVKDPDRKTVVQRRNERLAQEKEDFSDDHYLADLYQDGEIQPLIAYIPPWITDLIKMRTEYSGPQEDFVILTKEEKEQMRNLPRKEYLLNRENKQDLLLSLVDILFAYAYSVRTTEGENTVESAWTIAKLSSTLSWLETHSSLKSAALSSIQRSLCYPLYRHWQLAQLVLQDTISILYLGTKWVLKCLLDVHSIFSKSEPYFILNNLYITDYCIWVQSLENKTFYKMATTLETLDINKSHVDLELPQLEKAAQLALEERDATNLSTQLNALHLPEANSSSEGETDSDDHLSDTSNEDTSNASSGESSSSSDDDSEDEHNLLKENVEKVR